MPLSKRVKHPLSNTRKIACVSAAVGAVFFLLFIVAMLTLTWHKRSQGYDQLVLRNQQSLRDSFAELKTTLNPLRDLTALPCSQIGNELTSRAAFTNNVRAILLVREGIAYCSSATGAFSLPVSSFSAASNLDNDFDITLIAGTPMLPEKPAMVIWLKVPGSERTGVLTTLNINLTPNLLLASRQQDLSGMAMAVGDHAVATWNRVMVNKSELPQNPLRAMTVAGLPITFYLFGHTLPQRDIQQILLVGLLLALLITSCCYLLLSRHLRPGKEILQGIKRGEFHVEYQPVIEASSSSPYGLEALLRWTHPTQGRIPPDAFISYAEAQNLIIPLTRHLFELVARDAHRLVQAIPRGTKMGVNLSPVHLSSASFRDDVTRWTKAMPDGHFSYVFEITERTMVSERHATETFDWIHNQGFKLAIDDFGTGHSALIYLEKFKFDYLKIDRGFVQSIGMETVTSPVLDAVLNLAKKLNLSTVAEGVETEEQASWLLKRGVTHMQGYLFARPMNVTQLISYFQTSRSVLS
ncbi:cyclic di-GMP phosphodiesterase [Erwinia sp. V71]|uniref:cyclic di-GMP phosphodiesterase n=1 Tax=Erwinia sp. V71 TaxID=3369424 RepID=UPI003F5E02B9